MKKFKNIIAVIGGAGRVGLPLSVKLALEGNYVYVYDKNTYFNEKANQGIFPFKEENGDKYLKQALKNKTINFNTKTEDLKKADIFIFAIGTPIDNHLNPNFHLVDELVSEFADFFEKDNHVIFRSTVYPGFSKEFFKKVKNKNIHYSFCPERIVEGKAFTELEKLPQIISSYSDEGLKKSAEIFNFAKKTIQVEVLEAEYIKLFNNAWRYIKFACANQFFMLANNEGLDFAKIHKAMTADYDRASDFPHAGLAAGPCLYKDTAQLSTFTNDFLLGHSAISINEGLPLYIVKKLESKYNLGAKKILILGMAFKKESDNIRDSLTVKLKRLLEIKAREVLCFDPYIEKYSKPEVSTLITQADIIILGTNHDIFKNLDYKNKPVIDISNFLDKGTLL